MFNEREAYLMAYRRAQGLTRTTDPQELRRRRELIEKYYQQNLRNVEPVPNYYPPKYDFHMEKFSHGGENRGYWVKLLPNNTLYAYDYVYEGSASYRPEVSKEHIDSCLDIIKCLSDEFPQIFRVVYDHVKDNPQEAYKYIANWCKNASKKFFYCAVDVGQEFLCDNSVYPSLREFRDKWWNDPQHGRYHGIWVKLLPNNTIEVGDYSADGEAVYYPDKTSKYFPYEYLESCFSTIVGLSHKYPQIFKVVYLHISGNSKPAYRHLAKWCERYAQKYLECVIND